MKIVQSLWSCGKNLLSADFGWLTPQHHLMAWTLSCLRLHEHYDDLHLYTDQNGHEILITHLKLPYKEVHTVYDNIDNRHESNFAIAKMRTYSAQTEPFIHVDGDVFIWDRFNSDVENAALIAQNPEKGTVYYRSLMDTLKEKLDYIPGFLETELAKISIPSCNAGILGGNDVEFLNRYASMGLQLIEKNCVETGNYKLSGNFNILFEQILFRALSSRENKKVTCLIPETIDDNGYSDAKFADFSLVPRRLKYLHLIGCKNRDKEICALKSRTLFQQYPEYFYRVIELFGAEHIHFDWHIKTIFSVENSNKALFYKKASAEAGTNPEASKDILEYQQILAKLASDWKRIDTGYLYALEQIPADGFLEFLDSNESRSSSVISRNPYLVIIEGSFNWSPETRNSIEPRLVSPDPDEMLGIACIPQLFFDGCSRVIIDELDFNILTLLENPMFLKDILYSLESCFGVPDDDTRSVICELTLIRLKRLFLNKCIFIKAPSAFQNDQLMAIEPVAVN